MTTRNRRSAWLAAPAIALLLAACSDDDPASTTTTTSDPTSLTGDTGTDTTDDDVIDDDVIDDIESTGESAQDQLEEALRNAGLTSLASAVAQVDLSEVLEGNEFTVFAPDDEAFLNLDSDELTALLADPGQILDLLGNHIVVGEPLTADDLADQASVTTESGTTLAITGTGSSLSVGDATVVSTNTVGDIGVIHVIDTVLLVGSTS